MSLFFRPPSACCLCEERGVVSDLGSKVPCGFHPGGLFIEFHAEQGFSFSALLSRIDSRPRQGGGWGHAPPSNSAVLSGVR